MAFESILFEKFEGHVGKITMNRPEVRNAEDRQLTYEIQQAFRDADADDDVRVIIFAGAGKDFSAGHDLGSPRAKKQREEMLAQPNAQERMLEMGFLHEHGTWLEGYMRVRDIWKPTIAQVQGHCVLGAMMLVYMCDLIVAAEDAIFAPRSVRFGAPDLEFSGTPWDFGIRKAKELLFTGDAISGKEAFRIGFVNRCVPLAQLEEETMNLAKKIALNHPFALKLAKMALNTTQDIQGYKTSMIPQIALHQMGHANMRENPEYAPSLGQVRQAGGSVKDVVKARDEQFGDTFGGKK
ncbi:enoyl-CoA hydratase [Chloroflexota bacterium]